MKVVVKTNLFYKGKTVLEGDTVIVDKETGERLIADKQATAAPSTGGKTTKKTPTPPSEDNSDGD